MNVLVHLKNYYGGNKPVSLFSDQDSTFMSNQFTDMLRENIIIYNINTLNDHCRVWPFDPMG